ncbi:MAG: hypothetical protein ACR2HR_03435 [Euzebya sp.]
MSSGAQVHQTSDYDFGALLDELLHADDERPDVAVKHESEWALSALRGGMVIWENVEAVSTPQHMESLEREEIIQLMGMVATGDLDGVRRRPWLPSYGTEHR